MPLSPSLLSSLARGAMLAALGAALAGCTASGRQSALGQNRPAPGTQADVTLAAAHWQERFERNPADEQVAFAYGRALLAQDQRAQAVAVLRRAVLANTGSRLLKGELGKALAANGQFGEALAMFGQAHSADRPDWRILSAQGAVLDQMGRPQDARTYYQSALRLAPGEPSVLSNLGLSYALAGELPAAERSLREAQASSRADGRVRQNLALVVGLQGRFEEAERVARQDLPAEQAEQNVALVRSMLRQRNSWASLRQGQTPPAQAAAVPPAAPAEPRGMYAAQALAEEQRPAPPATAAATAARPPRAAEGGTAPSGELLSSGATRRQTMTPAQAAQVLGGAS